VAERITVLLIGVGIFHSVLQFIVYFLFFIVFFNYFLIPIVKNMALFEILSKVTVCR